MADLSVKLNNIVFKNPVLTAAGPNVRTGELMAAAAKAGAGGIVSKTVSVHPARDPKPTIRKAQCRGIINCETWSETSAENFLVEYQKVKNTGIPLIISIGYWPEDVKWLGAFMEKEIKPDAIEFSTHYIGRSVEPILETARALRESVSIPIWLKVSPHFPDIEEMAVRVSPYVDCFVATNSYGPVLDFDIETMNPLLGSDNGQGWLSGPPILPIALRIVYQIALVQDKPIIGVGGIERGIDAIKFFMAGASLVQVCSAAIKEGHDVYGKIASQINKWLDEHDYNSIDEIKGLYRKKLKEKREVLNQPVMSIDTENCTGCGVCVKKCIQGALYMNGDIPVVLSENCIGCGFCQDFCDPGAMSLEKNKKASM
ncbi:Dihydrothymine dehydrogenase [Candidatus Magnetomoraceae bacterium gMMP-1]